MHYTEVSLQLDPDFADILTAELANLGYESFVETEEGLNAYIVSSDFNESALQAVIDKYAGQTAIVYQASALEKRNWNEEWERSYQPIEVAGQVRVRASFHEPDPAYRYDLVINPKMSFGTGHHETTAMMLEQQLTHTAEGKAVLDVGSGTGILAILAARQGARRALAFDIEDWAVENARENADLNGCPQLEVFLGMISDVSPDDRFELVLANINRNVLLADIPAYVARMSSGAVLLVSGFYETDAPDIEACGREAGLTVLNRLTKNNWASIGFRM